MTLVKWIEFRVIGDGRGDLVALEGNKNIPFVIKRVYFLKNMKSDHPRGFHAHKKLKQIMICLAGTCQMLLDNGRSKESIQLNSFSKGLVIENMIWHEMHDFSEDCILMILADEFYDEQDYIRDYQEFISLVQLEV